MNKKTDTALADYLRARDLGSLIMSKLHWAVIIILLTAGCAATYQTNDVKPISTTLDSSLGILISVPENGSFGHQHYANSGVMTANALRSAFMMHTSSVEVTDDCHGEACLSEAYVIKYGYYVKPVILHWEERNTEWSGKRDKIEIQVTIYDTKSQQVVSSTRFAGKSKWATFGGDHPQELLPKPTNEFVDNLYR
jgi:hypothetical protein